MKRRRRVAELDLCNLSSTIFFFCGTDCRSVLMSEFTRRVSDARAKTTHNALECQAVHPRHFARPTQCRVAQARPNQKIQLRHSATTTRTRHNVEQRVKHPIEITRNRIVTPRQSHRNGERQKKRKRREKRFRSYALTTPRFANSVPSHHALVPRGNCTISTNVVVTIPREQSIHHQGGRVRFTGVLHLLGASCRHDSLHSFLQSEHFARRGGLLGSLQHRPFCTSR